MSRSDYRESHLSDEAARAYQDVYASGYYAAQWDQLERPWLESVFKQLRSTGHRTMLDLACGQGRIALVGARYFETIVGIDFSPEMLAHASHTRLCDPALANGNVQFQIGDVRTYTADSPFDVVTAFRFFLNAEDELRTEGLRCARRNLTPSGVFVANIHVSAISPLAYFYNVSNAANRLIGKTPNSVRNSMSLQRFERMLAAEGFRIERTYRYSILPRIGSRTNSLAERSMAKIERLKYLIPGLGLFSQAFVVCARPI